MISTVFSSIPFGPEAVSVTVECSVTPGVGVHIVGLSDQQMNESLLRTITALQAQGYRIPGKKIIVNIAPAVHESTALDLPIAVAIIAASEQVELPLLGGIPLGGELALDGSVRPVRGAFMMAENAVAEGRKGIILPKRNAAEILATHLLPEDFRLWGVNTMSEAISILQGKDDGSLLARNSSAYKLIEGHMPLPFPRITKSILRAVEIAAGGGFDIVVRGGDAACRNVAFALARLLPSTPELLRQQVRIHSASDRLGLFVVGSIPTVRLPHHRASAAAMLGGGAAVQPGEVSLAHGGVLFLEEPMVPSSIREAVLSVHQAGEAVISRLKDKFRYPASFRLVAAASLNDAAATAARIATRIRAIHIFAGNDVPVEGPMLATQKDFEEAASRVARVLAAQKERYAGEEYSDNAHVHASKIRRHAVIDGECEDLLEKIFVNLGLSCRDYSDIILTARTIADLDGKTDISVAAVAEAASYRFRDGNAKAA